MQLNDLRERKKAESKGKSLRERSEHPQKKAKSPYARKGVFWAVCALAIAVMVIFIVRPAVEIYQRSQLAVKFVMDFDNVASITGDSDTGNNVHIVDQNEWKSRLLSDVDPDSDLYETISSDPMFYIEATSIAKNPRVTHIDGDTYTVTYERAGTQGDVPGWSKRFETDSMRITFSDQNLVTSWS